MKMNSAFVAVVFALAMGNASAAKVPPAPVAKQRANSLNQGSGVPSFMIKPKVGRTIKSDFKKKDDGADAPSHLQCGVTTQVNSASNKWDNCPKECPYFAQNREDTKHCTFLCVTGDKCERWNAKKPIPDVVKRTRTCRGPMVQFCTEAALDGTDSCLKCQTGFALHKEDGQCYFSYWNTIIGFTVVILIIVAFLAGWVIDLCCREWTTQEEKDAADERIREAEKFRSQSKILTPAMADPQGNGRRRTYDIKTNCCKEDVAGPGMLLHFNFQAFLIVWPLVIAIFWTILACFHNELFILGTRQFGTPRQNCILVAWGYETQQRLMYTKVLFLVMTYVFSVVYFLYFGIRQHKIYEVADATESTMKDFAVELKGLPAVTADPNAEKDIAKAVEDAIGKKPVGVSIAWNYSLSEVGEDKQAAILNAVRNDHHADPTDESDPTKNMGWVHQHMYNIEKKLLGPDDDQNLTDEEITELIKSLKSSESAFVVFTTEEDKDAAVAKVSEGGIKFTYGGEDHTLTVEELECEPKTVNWENFGDSSFAAMAKRFLYGFTVYYLVALAIWFFVFYVPYAASLYYFNYDNGAQLPGYYAIIFTMVVVGGNATMYVVCDICCDVIGFKYKDTKQTVYMLMYLFACTFNVLLDMVVTYYTAMNIMTGLDFRTYDGTRLADIDTFTVQFETYAMQRSLAENAYRYAFPSTFLVPFLIEPFITVLIPFQVGKLIIRTHKEVQGACAEAYIAAFDFDLGRYADIILNVFLGILIFYFPGGYTWSLFYGMFISHIVIYLFDHWRVLQAIPTIKIVSRSVDWWAQIALGACCAVILSCLVFKANCETYSGYCIQGTPLVLSCTIAGVVHFIVHTLLIYYLVPALGKIDKTQYSKGEVKTFADVAREGPDSWFNVNPVHCLRSKFIHKDAPYCKWSTVGKSHLLEVNEKINCYYECEEAETEDYTSGNSMRELRKSVTGGSVS